MVSVRPAPSGLPTTPWRSGRPPPPRADTVKSPGSPMETHACAPATVRHRAMPVLAVDGDGVRARDGQQPFGQGLDVGPSVPDGRRTRRSRSRTVGDTKSSRTTRVRPCGSSSQTSAAAGSWAKNPASGVAPSRRSRPLDARRHRTRVRAGRARRCRANLGAVKRTAPPSRPGHPRQSVVPAVRTLGTVRDRPFRQGAVVDRTPRHHRLAAERLAESFVDRCCPPPAECRRATSARPAQVARTIGSQRCLATAYQGSRPPDGSRVPWTLPKPPSKMAARLWEGGCSLTHRFLEVEHAGQPCPGAWACLGRDGRSRCGDHFDVHSLARAALDLKRDLHARDRQSRRSRSRYGGVTTSSALLRRHCASAARNNDAW